jgi:hypothetical protein
MIVTRSAHDSTASTPSVSIMPMRKADAHGRRYKNGDPLACPHSRAMSPPPPPPYSPSPSQWQRRPRIRPTQSPSSPSPADLLIQQDISIGTGPARALGPRLQSNKSMEENSINRTRSPKLLLSHAHEGLLLPTAVISLPSQSTTEIPEVADNRKIGRRISGASFYVEQRSASEGCASVGTASRSVQRDSAYGVPPFFPSPTQCVAFRHEYLLQMSKKSKRNARGGSIGGVGDIMDSLVSSIDEIDSKQMPAGFPLPNGHRRQQSDDFQSVVLVSPAPVIQTSKSSTRSPGSRNKLSKRSGRIMREGANGRLSLRSSGSQEHWLPPIEQEEDIFSIPSARSSMHIAPPSPRPPSIPARSTSITHDLPIAQIPQRANSLMHTTAPPSIVTGRLSARRADTDIPPYAHQYLRQRTESKENLDMPKSPRPPFANSRSRNSTTSIPATNEHYQRLKLVTKRQSSQGFERDLSVTRHYYSLPPPPPNAPRRSASLKPSRSSLTSDGSSFGGVNSNYVQEVLSNPKLTQRIRLTSGRILSFSEVRFRGDGLMVGWG